MPEDCPTCDGLQYTTGHSGRPQVIVPESFGASQLGSMESQIAQAMAMASAVGTGHASGNAETSQLRADVARALPTLQSVPLLDGVSVLPGVQEGIPPRPFTLAETNENFMLSETDSSGVVPVEDQGLLLSGGLPDIGWRMPKPIVFWPWYWTWLRRLLQIIDHKTKQPKNMKAPQLPAEGKRPCDGSTSTFQTSVDGLYYEPICLYEVDAPKESTEDELAALKNALAKKCFEPDWLTWKENFRKNWRDAPGVSIETAQLAEADVCNSVSRLCPRKCPLICRVTDWWALLDSVMHWGDLDADELKQRFGEIEGVKIFEKKNSDGSVTYTCVVGVILKLTWYVEVEVGCEEEV